jgi:hypothetical protein
LEGQTALHRACHRGALHLVAALLDCGASVWVGDAQGQTALHVAASVAIPPSVSHEYDYGGAGGGGGPLITEGFVCRVQSPSLALEPSGGVNANEDSFHRDDSGCNDGSGKEEVEDGSDRAGSGDNDPRSSGDNDPRSEARRPEVLRTASQAAILLLLVHHASNQDRTSGGASSAQSFSSASKIPTRQAHCDGSRSVTGSAQVDEWRQEHREVSSSDSTNSSTSSSTSSTNSANAAAQSIALQLDLSDQLASKLQRSSGAGTTREPEGSVRDRAISMTRERSSSKASHIGQSNAVTVMGVEEDDERDIVASFVNWQDDEGSSALHYATTRKAVQILAENAGDLCLVNSKGQSPLFGLAFHQDPRHTLRQLAQCVESGQREASGRASKGAEFSNASGRWSEGDGATSWVMTNLLGQQDHEGNTALHTAVILGHETSAVALVQAGASLHVLNNETETVLDLAERREERRVSGEDERRDISSVRLNDVSTGGSGEIEGGRRPMVVALLRSMTMRPTWVPDELVHRCLCCRSRFTVSLRRHHCRHCGRVVCARCSPNKVKIEKFKYEKSQRVCSTCFDVLTFRRLE